MIFTFSVIGEYAIVNYWDVIIILPKFNDIYILSDRGIRYS